MGMAVEMAVEEAVRRKGRVPAHKNGASTGKLITATANENKQDWK